MAKKLYKFRLKPGQKAPDGSTGQTVGDTGWLVCELEEGVEWPDLSIEHAEMTPDEIECCKPHVVLRDSAWSYIESQPFKMVIRAMFKVIYKDLDVSKAIEKTENDLVQEMIDLIKSGALD